MAATTVTLLTSATQAASGTSTPLDVTNNGPLHAVISSRPNYGTEDALTVWFDTGKTATGPWREIASVQMDTAQLPPQPLAYDMEKRLQLDCDLFVRARWLLKRTRNDSGAAPTITLGITAVTVVSA